MNKSKQKEMLHQNVYLVCKHLPKFFLVFVGEKEKNAFWDGHAIFSIISV